MDRTMVIRFRPGKSPEIKTAGFMGNACQEFSAPYIKALGGKVLSDRPTEEANATTSLGQTVQQ